jgi:hypothetical protein
MADKSFGVKELNLISASGTPTITSPNSVNINATNVAISTDITVGGMVSLGAGTSISSPGTNVLTFGTNSTEKVRITSAGQVKVGGNTLATPNGNADNFVIDTGDVDSGLSILSATTGRIYFGDAADAAAGSIRYVHTDNSMRFEAAGGERLRITSDGNIGMGGITSPSFTTGNGLHLGDNYAIGFGAGGNSRPDFQIVSDGSSLDFRCGFGADTTDISMTTGGNLAFASGGGIDFSATSDGPNVSSELLDDYEEGTFEPIFRGASGTFNTVAYHGDTGGRYTKVGNLVMVTGCVRINGGTLDKSNISSTDTLCIGGLPFNNNARTNGDNADNHGTLRVPVWSGSNCPQFIQARQNVDFCNLYFISSLGGIHSTSQVSQLTNQSMVQFTLVYTSG